MAGGGTPDFTAAAMSSARLLLTPLRADDADAMTDVLGDERLHEFIGGRPATRAELRTRYRKLEVGSGNPREIWLNWIVRLRRTGEPVGTVQATVTNDGSEWTAHIAWVIGVPWQSQGYATEAAGALADWLRTRGAGALVATIHPDHATSAAVAERIGLRLTDEEIDGERVWRA
ncbi:MAG TPA: GNAT family N-acetyltransferase [Pseudonocardiaceae bacterium]|jgi:RimJ/RimL family protein N-acetyltransferase|nr:GNAT family N-acetyltransferase [Pseudonocardiaceae bacterium]